MQLRYLTAFLFIATIAAFGQGSVVTGVPVVVSPLGQPLPGAIVAVCNTDPGSPTIGGCPGHLATLYTDITIGTACSGTGQPLSNPGGLGTGCANPGTVDGQGNVIAYAAQGQYWCEYYSGGIIGVKVMPCIFPTTAAGALATIVYNVKIYGAVGDGSHDDTAAINTAWTACQASGGQLYFPDGTYLISSTLTVPTDVNHYSRCALKGELDHEISSSSTVPGAVIKTSSNFTALKTATLTKKVTDGAMTSGSATLTSATASFTVADIGKNITVLGANTALAGAGVSTALITTISGFTNSTTVTLATTAGTTVSGAAFYYGNDGLANWTKDFSISDLYIQGPQLLASANTTTIGCDFEGVQFLRAQNLHCEGFGTGLQLLNGSEITFQGRTLLQNNYTGANIARVNNTDMQAWFDDLYTVNNQIPLILDNARSVFVAAGENVTTGLTRTPLPRIQVKNSANSQYVFTHYTMENDEAIASVQTDAFGVSVLSLDGSDFQSTTSGTIVETTGYFDLISITNSAFDRTTGLQNPKVWLHSAITSDPFLRANQVILSGNSPAWFEIAVKNDNVSRSPLQDFVPASFQEINQVPSLDQAADNHITALGTYGFTAVNVLSGNARMTWTTAAATNFVTDTFQRTLRGVDVIYVTTIVDDNSGATAPQINSIGGLAGGTPTDWQQAASYKLGSWTVGARTYTKYGIAIQVLNKTAAAAGITSLQMGNIYGEGTGSSGMETLNIYVNTKQTGFVQFTPRTVATNPSGLTSGYCAAGDVAYFSAPILLQPTSYVCSVAGIPGTWFQIVAPQTDSTQPIFTSVTATNVTVAALPAAAAGNKGQVRIVSDSTAIAAEGQVCAGGGAVTALAFSTGAAWKCF